MQEIAAGENKLINYRWRRSEGLIMWLIHLVILSLETTVMIMTLKEKNHQAVVQIGFKSIVEYELKHSIRKRN